jgi:hypothetical protein
MTNMKDYVSRGLHAHSASGLTKVGPNSADANSVTALALNSSVDTLELMIAQLRARITLLETQLAAKA